VMHVFVCWLVGLFVCLYVYDVQGNFLKST